MAHVEGCPLIILLTLSIACMQPRVSQELTHHLGRRSHKDNRYSKQPSWALRFQLHFQLRF
jgi:hypothetical protein